VQGLAGVALTTGASTSLQLVAPAPLRGRVMSLYSLLFLGSTPSGATLTGAVAEAYDVRVALALDSAGCIPGVLLGRADLRRSSARAEPAALDPKGGAHGVV
jgi:MFS family permease